MRGFELIATVEPAPRLRATALAVHVDPNVLKRSDAHAVEELVLAALRDGLAKVDKLAETHMLRVTGGMPLPGLFL